VKIALFEKHTNLINALFGQKSAYCSVKGSGVIKSTKYKCWKNCNF